MSAAFAPAYVMAIAHVRKPDAELFAFDLGSHGRRWGNAGADVAAHGAGDHDFAAAEARERGF